MYMCYILATLFSYQKENPAIDGTWEHYAKQNKLNRVRQTLHGVNYMWNLRKIKKKESQVHKESWKVVTRSFRVGEIERDWYMDKYSDIIWISYDNLMYICCISDVYLLYVTSDCQNLFMLQKCTL